MSFLYGKKDRLDVLPDQLQSEAMPTLMQNFQAASDSAYVSDQSVSKGRLLQQQWEPIIEEVNARSGGIPYPNPADVYLDNALSGIIFPSLNESTYQTDADAIINHINENPDIYPDLLGVTKEGLLENSKAEALALRREYEETADDSPGFLPGLVRFAGAVHGTVSDPVLLYSMAQTRGATAVPGLMGVMFREAAIGAGTEAIIQKDVKDWYESLGLDYTWEDFATNVAIGGVFGAGAPLVFKIGGDTITLTADQAQKGYEALVRSGAFKPKGTTKAAERARDAQQDIADANPLEDDNVHQERITRAAVAAENNRPPAMPDEPPAAVKPPSSVYDADNLDGLVYRFDPNEIQVDAETFQFKAGGDEFGVSDRLQGVTEWDPIKAGQVTVYEFADGSQFIADGHQRLGLAKRIQQQDPSQDVRLYGHLLREVDGFTPEMARVAAAMKNIAEGTGTAIDAAKVLRVAPERMGELPPRSALVRQAQELTFLDDDVFGAVINGLVPANYGAVVGRLIPDNPGLQQNAVSILAKTDPANEFQAEAIVRQIREAGFEQREQVGLFGDELITESYFTERARILDRAQKLLRQDKNAFSSLVNNADRLQTEGNILAQNANQRRAENDAQALALLQALANKVGPLSDALTAAARQARETGSYTEPSRGFVDAIRNAIESGDFERIGAGDVGRPGNDPAQSRVRADEAEPELEGFDDASGAAASRQADQLTEDLLPESVGETPESIEPTPIDSAVPPDYIYQDRSVPEGDYIRVDSPDPGYTGKQRFFVYRIMSSKELGPGIEPLADRNAADLEGVLGHYDYLEDKGMMSGDTLVRYEVEVTGGLSAYEPLQSGKIRVLADVDKTDNLVGISDYKGGKAYSFRSGGQWKVIGGYERYDFSEIGPAWSNLVFAERQNIDTTLPLEQQNEALREIELRVARDLLKERKPDYTTFPDVGSQVENFTAQQQFRNINEIYQEAPRAQDLLDKYFHKQVLKKALTPEEYENLTFINPGIKKRQTAREKYLRKQYTSVNQFTDIVRAGFIAKNPADAENLVRVLEQHYQIIDEGWSFTPFGYFDRKILFRNPRGGIVGEIQVWSPNMHEAKFNRGGEDMYQQGRKAGVPAETVETLKRDSKILYRSALASESPEWRALAGMSIDPNVANLFRNAWSEGRTFPVFATSQASTAAQLPPGSSMATATLESSQRSAGRLSQETKTGDVSIGPPEVSLDDLTPSINLDEEIPVDLRIGDDGEVISQTTTLRQIKEEIDQDQAMLDRLEGCIR